MKKKLYFIRHGETDWNTEGRSMGQADIPLNTIGKQQAHATQNLLKKLPITLIFSSDLKRAKETAHIINCALNLPIIYSSALREFNIGQLSGLLKSEICQKVPLDPRDPTHWDICMPNGETRRQMKERLLHFFKEECSQYPDKHILIVTHSGVINLINILLTRQGITVQNTECISCVYDTTTHTFSHLQKLEEQNKKI